MATSLLERQKLGRRRSSRLADYPYMRCRSWGHRWDEFMPVGMRPPSFGVRESVLCDRCSTERHFLIDSLGRVASRRMIYPHDYRLGFHAPRAEFRRELRRQGFYDPEKMRNAGAPKRRSRAARRRRSA